MTSPIEAGARADLRFYIDHGMIHDRVTGKHIVTDGEWPFEDDLPRVLVFLNSLAPPDECLVPKSDRDDLDDVCRELGIQDSEVTPAQAVRELNTEIERLAAIASGALVPASQWQDISTVPMEQPIDILCQEEGGEQHRFCDVTILDREPRAFTFVDTNGKHTYFPHENGMWITHWMPLPASPNGRAGT